MNPLGVVTSRKPSPGFNQDARAGHFDILLVWSLDRLSREGVAATLEIVNRLGQSGVKVWSLQESWTEVEGPLQELLLSIVAWVARMESERRSERTKAGIARARTEGKHIGRPAGAKDKTRRRRSGYFARYADQTKATSALGVTATTE